MFVSVIKLVFNLAPTCNTGNINVIKYTEKTVAAVFSI